MLKIKQLNSTRPQVQTVHKIKRNWKRAVIKTGEINWRKWVKYWTEKGIK